MNEPYRIKRKRRAESRVMISAMTVGKVIINEKTRIYVLIFSTVSLLTGSVIFYFEQSSLQVGTRLFLHFYILITVSMVLSLILFFTGDEIGRTVMAVLKLLVILLIGYPLGSNIIIEIILFAGIIFETVFYLQFRHGVILILIMNITFIMTQQAPRPGMRSSSL